MFTVLSNNTRTKNKQYSVDRLSLLRYLISLFSKACQYCRLTGRNAIARPNTSNFFHINHNVNCVYHIWYTQGPGGLGLISHQPQCQLCVSYMIHTGARGIRVNRQRVKSKIWISPYTNRACPSGMEETVYTSMYEYSMCVWLLCSVYIQ